MAKKRQKNRKKRDKKGDTFVGVQDAFSKEFDERMRSAEAPKEEVFVVDKKPAYVTPEDRKAAYRKKLTTSERILAPNPKVPHITTTATRKRVHSQKELRKADKYASNKAAADEREAKKPKLAPKLDLWAEEETHAYIPKFDDKWEDIKDALESRHAPKKPRVLAPKVAIPSKMLPEPGQSYRPSAEDHEELMAKAVAIARQRNEEEEGAEDTLLHVTKKGNNFLLPVDVDAPPPPDDPNFVPYVKPPTTRLGKYQQRNRDKKKRKEMRAKEDAREHRADARMEKIDDFIAEIEAKKVIMDKRVALRQVIKEEKKLMTKRHGSHVEYVEPLPAVAFKSEIVSRFKDNKSLVNPLLERFEIMTRTGKAFTSSQRPRAQKRQKRVLTKFSARDETSMTQKEAGKLYRDLAA